jgi:hypothetical protein
MRLHYRWLFGAIGIAAMLGFTGRADAEILYATSTTFNSPYPSFLLTFDTASPGTLQSNVQMNGADIGTPATGNPNGQQFVISGVDFRPSNFILYGLGYRSGFEQRVYTINPNTGIVTALFAVDRKRLRCDRTECGSAVAFVFRQPGEWFGC